jgi:membrane protease YdiL (CAAX protease family)
LGIIILTPLLQSYLYIQNYFINELAKASSFANSIKEALDSLNDLVEKAYGDLIYASNIFEGILVVFVVALTPAVCEEFMFRGFIQRSFEFKLKPFWAAFITALFFGLYHFNPYGIIPLMMLGLYFGFAAYISNSILVPVLLHFLNNFAAVMLYFIIGDDELISSAPTTDIDINSSIITFIFLLALFSGLIILIKRYYQKVSSS